ncbi:MAG: TolC family protein [Nitrospira sp.]|nr:MAG: TolC family protein [Nitrospira sp.]
MRNPRSLVIGFLLAALIGSAGSTWAAVSQENSPGGQPPQELERDAPISKGAFLGYETAIQISFKHHPLLRKAQKAALVAEAVTDQAKSRYYPELNAYALQTGGTIRPLSVFNIAGAQNKPTSYVESAGVRADQLIYDFGQTTHKVLAEQAGQEAAEKDILAKKASVIFRVQQTYIHCLRQKRLREIAEATVRERGVLRDQIASLHKHQLKSKLDLDLISVELKNAEVQLLQAKNELLAAFAALNNAMGVRGVEDYTLEDVPTAMTSWGTLESLIQQGLKDRPELMGVADRIRQAEEQLNSAKALALPTISALGTYGVIHFSDAPTNQYAGSHPGQTNLWWGAGVTISTPLFTGFFIENHVAGARENKYKMDQRKADLSNKITLEVTDAYLTVQTAQQQVKVEEREVEAARSALTLAKERYRLGLASIVDITTATTAFLLAQVMLSEAQYAVQAGAVALTYATGKGYLQF